MQAEMRMYIPQLLRLRNAFVPFLCRSPFGGKLTSLALLFRSECVMYDYGAASKFEKRRSRWIGNGQRGSISLSPNYTQEEMLRADPPVIKRFNHLFSARLGAFDETSS